MLSKKAILALMIPVIALTGCGKKGLIVVNGEKISKDEFYARLERIPVPVKQGNQTITVPAGRYLVQQMINEQLVQQLARKQDVAPTNEQIESKIKTINKQNNGNINGWLASQGMTLEDLKKTLRADQAQINLFTKGVTVPWDDVKKFYDDTLKVKNSPLIRPEQVKTSIIIVEKKDKIDKVYKKLTDGADFSTVAMQMSEVGGGRRDAGQLDWFSLDDPRPIPKEVKQTAFATPVSRFSKPFTASGGWVIVKVDDRRPQRITQYDDIKEVIRERLAMQKAAGNSKFNDDLRAFTKSARITVNDSRYQSIADAIKKQADNAQAPAAGPATRNAASATPTTAGATSP